MPKLRHVTSLTGDNDQYIRSTSENTDGECVGLTKSGVYLYMNPTWCERIYSTKRDSTKVRTLKRFHILPKSPKSVTYAEIGVGVNLFPDIDSYINDMAAIRDRMARFTDVLDKILTHQRTTKKLLKQAENSFAAMSGHRRNLAIELAEKEEQVQKCSHEANEYKQKWQCSQEFTKKMFEELKSLKEEMERVETKLEDVTKEKNQQAADNKNLKQMLEDLTLAEDHTCHEKELVEKDLQEAGNAIRILKEEYWAVMDQVTSYKRMYLQTKVDASDIITHYVQQLNYSLDEKQSVLLAKLSKTSDSAMKKTLTSANEYLELKTENNRLVDQLEFLSSKAAVQDVYIEELQEELAVKDKCLSAFEGTDHQPKDEEESRLVAFIKKKEEGDGVRQQRAGREMYKLANQRELEQWINNVTDTPPGEHIKRRHVKRRDVSPVSSKRETLDDLSSIGKQREAHHKNESLQTTPTSGKYRDPVPMKTVREDRHSSDITVSAPPGGERHDSTPNKKDRAERLDRSSPKSTSSYRKTIEKITPKKDPEDRKSGNSAESAPPGGQITDMSPSRKHREGRHRKEASQSTRSAKIHSSQSGEFKECHNEKNVDRHKSRRHKASDSEHPIMSTRPRSHNGTPNTKSESDEFLTPPDSPRDELGRKVQTHKDCSSYGKHQHTKIPSHKSLKGMARIGSNTAGHFQKQRAKATGKESLPDQIYCAP